MQIWMQIKKESGEKRGGEKGVLHTKVCSVMHMNLRYVFFPIQVSRKMPKRHNIRRTLPIGL